MPSLDLSVPGGATISLGDDAAAPVRFAAGELQRYLQAMTGVGLAVTPHASLHGAHAVVLGRPADVLAPAPDAGFHLRPDGDRVVLRGASPRLLLDAAYALLEQLGCRWALPGAGDEVVPRRGDAVIAVAHVERTPPFAVRGYTSDIMTWHYLQPEHLESRLPEDRRFIDWMGKSGANAFFYIRHPFDTQLHIPELAADFAVRGIAAEYGGHVIPLLLPRPLFDVHPEYFPAATGGQRTDHGNLCTSHAAALRVIGDTAIEWAREHPEMETFHIWGADLWRGGWCHCADCAPLSAADQSLRACNAVAQALAAAGLARPVCYLAYHDTLDAALTVAPDPRVVAEFAPRERCYGHAMNDPACRTNRRYAAALERYVDLFDGRVRLFEYYGDAILYFGCAVPLTRVIDADLAYYRQLGIREILMLQFGAFSTWAYPLNFLTFAAATAGLPAAHACDAYASGYGRHAEAVQAAHVELEDIMRTVATYGDIRRPPRQAERAAELLPVIAAAVPRLEAVAERLAASTDERVLSQAGLVRYTRGVLAAVRQDLHAAAAGSAADGAQRYADALGILDGVDRRFKGLWGAVDLPLVHGYFAAHDG